LLKFRYIGRPIYKFVYYRHTQNTERGSIASYILERSQSARHQER
jgi:hypothetical protein